MLAAVDVHYEGPGATAACVLFRGWRDAAPSASVVVRLDHVEPYQPGQFYRRELPCILRLLAKVDEPLETIVVDGYVWLDAQGTPGLGAHLYLALDRAVPVVGVAKTSFRGSPHAAVVRRGASARPLYVTAVGVDVDDAARAVAAMHGPHRIPTLLRRADELARSRPAKT